jgi:hypothetical protein
VASIDEHAFSAGDLTKILMHDYMKVTGQTAEAAVSAA